LVRTLTIKALFLFGIAIAGLTGAGTVRADLPPGTPIPAYPGAAVGSFTVNFDEDGNGKITSGGKINTLQLFTPTGKGLGRDPSVKPHGFPALIYILPVAVEWGDVYVHEAGSGAFTDLIRFTNVQGDLQQPPSTSTHGPATLLIYYSERDGGSRTSHLADWSLPPNMSWNSKPLPGENRGDVNETTLSAAGGDNFSFTATAPGSAPGPSGSFQVSSDAPEIAPGSIAGALTVLVGGVLILRSRRSGSYSNAAK
jgi:hypothetical protein